MLVGIFLFFFKKEKKLILTENLFELLMKKMCYCFRLATTKSCQLRTQVGIDERENTGEAADADHRGVHYDQNFRRDL